jgi:hypothetical protein
MLFLLLMTPFYSQAGVVKGKVTSVRGNVLELDLGIEKGIQLGDSGKVYYNVLIERKEKPIFIARFKITHLSEKSSMAQVEEKTAEAKVGYLVEIVFKEGELELRSDPPGAKVYVDGKEKGETPSVLSNVRLGGHVIRIAKEGYGPYEENVKVAEGERKKVTASLKKTTGALLVNTDPPGATIFIDGKPVGVSPYEGKDLFSGTHRIRVVKEDYETWERDVVVEAGKGVEVFTMLREKKKVVAPPSPLPKAEEPKKKEQKRVDWAKKSCEAPVWKLGDKWIYKNATGGIWTKEVVDVKEDLFIQKITGIKPLLGFDRKTLKCTFLIEGGEKVKNTNPFRDFFDFPLFVGKKWSYPSISIPNDNKVEGVEEIKVPAGTFAVYKIYVVHKTEGAVSRSDIPKEGWQRYWYSPEVKNYVKRVVDKSGFWDHVKGLQDAELISYNLK